MYFSVMKKILFSIALMIVVVGFKSAAQENAQSGMQKYEKGSYIDGKDSIGYRVLYPENFDANKKYPILFFLHGRGESGSDNQKQLTHGGKFFLKEDVRRDFPAIVVFPQCASDSYWANVKITADSTGKRTFNFVKGGQPTIAMHALLGLVDDFLDKPFIDRKQVYAGGLSMGGMGTYELLRRRRNVFAASFAICGGDNVANIKKYRKTPLWIFHGERDDVVDPAFSVAIANHLKIYGREVKLTLYPDANHNSWDAALAEPQLLSWLFSHKK